MELDFTVAVHKVDSGVDIYKYMQLFKLQLKKLFPKYSEDLLSSSQCRIGRGENGFAAVYALCVLFHMIICGHYQFLSPFTNLCFQLVLMQEDSTSYLQLPRSKQLLRLQFKMERPSPLTSTTLPRCLTREAWSSLRDCCTPFLSIRSPLIPFLISTRI